MDADIASCKTSSGFLPAVSDTYQITLVTPTATDNCAGLITATTADPVYYDVVGTYTVEWTYDDGNGNTSSQSQLINVLPLTGVDSVQICEGDSVFIGNV